MSAPVFADVREVELRFDIHEAEVGCTRCSAFVLREFQRC